VCRGVDGTGNVYKPENLDSVEELMRKDGVLDKVNIAVSDGGFEIKKNEKGEHMENYQELFSGQIIISELLLTMKVLQPGGNFVCKLFDAFSTITQSVIYITTQIFEDVFLVKPIRSRIVNSEKYLVGRSLKREDNFEYFKNLLAELHKRCTNEASPRALVPIDVMRNDNQFMGSSRKVCEETCCKQTKALAKVLDEVDADVKRRKPHRH